MIGLMRKNTAWTVKCIWKTFWIDISAVGMIPNVTIVTANPLTTSAPQVTHWTFDLIFII